ncbi:MAG TPA: hypothetical protein VK851_02590 [Anaerolineales bacterium]|nr:hypothetical protein [Anaerolineales bacterium]
MKLTPPTQLTFWIAVVLGLLGLHAETGSLTLLPISAFYLVLIGFLVLLLGNVFENF